MSDTNETQEYGDIPVQVQDIITAYGAVLSAIDELIDDEDLQDENGIYESHPALQDALLSEIRDDVPLVQIAKEIARRGRRAPEMPTPVDIPVRDMALFEMWVEPSTKNSINPLLDDDKRALFEAKVAYDEALVSYRAVQEQVQEPIRLLIGLLHTELQRYGGQGAEARSAPKSRASPAPKSRVGDAGAYHVINPATGRTHVARERDWVLKNCKDSISREGFNPDEYLLEVFTFDDAGNKIPA